MAQTEHGRPAPGMRDHVEDLMAEWSAQRPDLPLAPVGIVNRLIRLAARWQADVERVFAAGGMTGTDFAVLSNLRRAGPPYQLTQRQLVDRLRLTSGTVSLRVDKLVAAGLVERRPDPTDARAARVTMTAAGEAAVDAMAPPHLANEARLVAALSATEQATLAQLLRTLLIEVEQPAAHRPDRRLGMTVTSAFDTQQRRAAVGLPPRPGLLVQAVQAGGPAAAAGIEVGDLVVAIEGVEQRSLTCVEAALAGAGASVAVSLHRSDADLVVDVAPGPVEDHPPA